MAFGLSMAKFQTNVLCQIYLKFCLVFQLLINDCTTWNASWWYQVQRSQKHWNFTHSTAVQSGIAQSQSLHYTGEAQDVPRSSLPIFGNTGQIHNKQNNTYHTLNCLYPQFGYWIYCMSRNAKFITFQTLWNQEKNSNLAVTCLSSLCLSWLVNSTVHWSMIKQNHKL